MSRSFSFFYYTFLSLPLEKPSNIRVTINIFPPHQLMQYTIDNECNLFPLYINNHHFSSLTRSKHPQTIQTPDILFRAVMIEAKQPSTMLYKFNLVVPRQFVDIWREMNKIKSIILSKISCNIYCDWYHCIDWFMFKRLNYFITHTNDKPTLCCGNCIQ